MLALLKLLCVYFVHVSAQVLQLVGITPLVVIPGNQLYKVVVQGDACACVEGGGVYIVDEIGRDKNTGKVVVKVNPKFFRPAEVELLIGNPEKAERELGWKREISFSELVERMAKNDLELVKKELGI